jgi:hypothetical protein
MDENRAAEFTGRVLSDSAAAATIVLAALGDRTGLFKDMAEHGPATSGELASRTGLSERYVREWLGGMFAAGYLSYDDAQQRYALPAEHVPTLATEPGPAFFGGVHQELIGAIQRYDQAAEAFRRGGGVRPADLHPTSGPGPAGSPRSGTRTCWSSSGCRWCRIPRPGCGPAPASPTSTAAPGRR